MEPVTSFAPLLAYVGALALAGLAVHQRKRIMALQAGMADSARTDPLTGLLNRRAFEEMLELEIERAKRGGRPLSLIVGDLDSFALVNERQGHAAGDTALQLVASDLLKWKRRIDHAARIGGEEFGVLFPETDAAGAFMVAERLRRATHRTFGDAPVALTISFGVASSPVHGSDAAGLLRAAYSAMATAKERGRDRTAVHSDDPISEIGRIA
jgi:diguanylate cyclase (GGDEF)-like protein